MKSRRRWPAFPFPFLLAVWLSLPAAAAYHAKPQWTLINPYPASGAVDIAGSTVATRVLRTMQRHVNPSVTDAAARAAQQAMTRGLDAEVMMHRQSRASGLAAAEEMKACESCLLMAGSGLASSDAAAALTHLKPLALLARIPTVWVTHAAKKSVTAGRTAERIGLPAERGAAAAWLRVLHGEKGLRSAITYNGGHGALRALLSREIVAALVHLPAAWPYLRNDRVRAHALDDNHRHPLLPELPGAAESGLPLSGTSGWYGLFSDTRGALSDAQILALRAALRSGDIVQSLNGLGFLPADGTPGELQQYAQREFAGPDGRSVGVPQSRISSGGFTDRKRNSSDKS
jgi:tripartite-type tricarboxylate transporter receptor subunit TctC